MFEKIPHALGKFFNKLLQFIIADGNGHRFTNGSATSSDCSGISLWEVFYKSFSGRSGR